MWQIGFPIISFPVVKNLHEGRGLSQYSRSMAGCPQKRTMVILAKLVTLAKLMVLATGHPIWIGGR